MTRTIRASSLRGRVDFAIITIRDDEFAAVLKRFSPTTPVFGSRQHYEYCNLWRSDGRSVSVAIVRSFSQGHAPALLVTQNTIEELAPRWIVLTGIAGAVLDSEFTLGDILLADSVHDFSVSAAIQGKPPQFRTGGGPMHPAVERLLTNLPARRSDLGDWNGASSIGRLKPTIVVPDDIDDDCYYGSEDDRKTTRKIFKQHFASSVAPRLPDFIIGAAATSNVLMKDTALLGQWKAAVRHITHVEMELGGAYIAARRAQPSEVPLLSVRGISDVVGFKRSDEWTQFACDAVASFLHALLRILPSETFGMTPRTRAVSLQAALTHLPSTLQRLANIWIDGVAGLMDRTSGRLLYRARATPSVESIVRAFAKSSAPLVSRTVDPGDRIPRHELGELEARFSSIAGRVLCLLGSPGSGKTALLALLAKNAAGAGIPTLAIKTDLLPTHTPFEDWGRRELGLDISAVDAVRVVSSRGRVLVIVDQLDALSSVVAVSSDLFNSVVNFVRQCSALPNVSVVCSCRAFDYSHDARFAELEADVVQLSLPAWKDVATHLSRRGVADAENWSMEFREILRTPQHLRIYLDRFDETGRADVVGSYHLMLDDLWNRNVNSDAERNLLDSITEVLMTTEALWAPAATFEGMPSTIRGLKAKGILEAQGHRIGFKHQTLLEHSKARFFTKTDKSFCEYVLHHQDTLQVRPTVWAVLQYLRDARTDKYRVEIESLFAARPRLHLRYLLIEFLGHIQAPEEFEKVLLGERLADTEDRVRVLISIRGNEAWFHAFLSSHFPTVMQGEIQHQWPMIGVINEEWSSAHDTCLELIHTFWFPDPDKDRLTQRVLRETDKWETREIEMASALIRRTKDDGYRLLWAENLVYVVSATRPELAPLLFVETMTRLANELADDSNKSKSRQWDPLESARMWYELPGVAEAAPTAFLRTGWNWLVATCEQFHRGHHSSVLNRYEGYILSLDEESHRPETPVLSAYLAAVDGTARAEPLAFVDITKDSWASEHAVVHRMIIRGLKAVATTRPEVGLEYLTGDSRRFGVGAYNDEQSDSIGLIASIAPLLKADDLRKLESVILSWTQYREGQELCEDQMTWDRKARLRLLLAIPTELLSTEASAVVQAENQMLPASDRTMPRSKSGFVKQIPPITKDEMMDVTEDQIVDVICQTPDIPRREREWKEVEGGWEEPGGPSAAGTELAELAKTNPHKVVEVVKRLVARGSFDAASRAVQDMHKSTLTDDELFSFVQELIGIGPSSNNLRQGIGYLLYQRARPPRGLPDDTCEALCGWLEGAGHAEDDAQKSAKSQVDEHRDNGESVLWSSARLMGLRSVDHSFWLLLAVSEGYLRRSTPANTEWLTTLEKCLERGLSHSTWSSYCLQLRHIRFLEVDKPRGIAFVVHLLRKVPAIWQTADGIVLIASVSDLIPGDTLKELLQLLRDSNKQITRQAYGELLTLIALTDAKHKWCREVLNRELSTAESPEYVEEPIVVGIAHAAANLWDVLQARSEAAEVLKRLVPIATENIGRAISTVFRAPLDFAADDCTERLLKSLAQNPESLAQIPIVDLVPHLVSLAPHMRALVLSVCDAILVRRATEDELFEVGPQLVKISMTLQRFPETRDGALALFEHLLRRGLDDAFRVLEDIDIRPTTRPEVPLRERRRRRRRNG